MGNAVSSPVPQTIHGGHEQFPGGKGRGRAAPALGWERCLIAGLSKQSQFRLMRRCRVELDRV